MAPFLNTTLTFNYKKCSELQNWYLPPGLRSCPMAEFAIRGSCWRTFLILLSQNFTYRSLASATRHLLHPTGQKWRRIREANLDGASRRARRPPGMREPRRRGPSAVPGRWISWRNRTQPSRWHSPRRSKSWRNLRCVCPGRMIRTPAMKRTEDCICILAGRTSDNVRAAPAEHKNLA